MQIQIIRTIPTYLNSFHQWKTYEALHEGLPTTDINIGIIERVKLRAQALYPQQSIHLIEPELTPFAMEGAFSEFSQYPRYTCVARILHMEAIRTITKAASSLVVIWMQENYAMPIDEEVLEKIKWIEWDMVADECDY